MSQSQVAPGLCPRFALARDRGYVRAHGFGEIYGDYGEAAITSSGATIAVWGEGYSYNGPGGTWFNLQR